MGAVTAKSDVYCVVGYPARHSLSPVIMNAAFQASGLDAIYVAFEPPPQHIEMTFAALARLGVRGISVTMPYKEVAGTIATTLSPTARALGGGNSLCLRDGGYHLESTDGPGLCDALIYEFGGSLAQRDVAVYGAGGAARAAVLELVNRGANVTVVGRSSTRVAEVVALCQGRAKPGTVTSMREASIVINATPVGMVGGPGGMPFPLDQLRRSTDVYDMVYAPRMTPLIQAAKDRGHRVAGGVSMLVFQACVSFVLWHETEAPFQVMMSAALRALGEV